MSRPIISIVTANYNSENTIKHTIESVLNQDFADWQLIIVDDGSTDASPEIIKQYVAQDKRISVVFNPHTGNISKVVNNGFKKAKGIYYATIDSDDMIKKDCLRLSLDFIKQQKSSKLIYTFHGTIDENNKYLGLGHRCNVPYNRQVLLLSFMTFHFRMFHRDLYYDLGGYDESFSRAVDYDFCLRASEKTDFKVLKEVLYFYRKHQKQVSVKTKEDQIRFTYLAINNAMIRRGLDKKFRLVYKKFYIDNLPYAKFKLAPRGSITIF